MKGYFRPFLPIQPQFLNAFLYVFSRGVTARSKRARGRNVDCLRAKKEENHEMLMYYRLKKFDSSTILQFRVLLGFTARVSIE